MQWWRSRIGSKVQGSEPAAGGSIQYAQDWRLLRRTGAATLQCVQRGQLIAELELGQRPAPLPVTSLTYDGTVSATAMFPVTGVE